MRGGGGPNAGAGRGRGGGGRGRGGRGGRGGGGMGEQRWWDPAWREARLRDMRQGHESSREQFDQDMWWKRLEKMKMSSDQQEEIIKTNYGREGAEVLEDMAHQLELYL